MSNLLIKENLLTTPAAPSVHLKQSLTIILNRKSVILKQPKQEMRKTMYFLDIGDTQQISLTRKSNHLYRHTVQNQKSGWETPSKH